MSGYEPGVVDVRSDSGFHASGVSDYALGFAKSFMNLILQSARRDRHKCQLRCLVATNRVQYSKF